MFDPEKLLAGMVGDALGGAFGRRSGRKSVFRTGDLGGKAALGLGALGVAMAAFEHFQERSRTDAGSRSQMPAGAPLPPPPPAAIAGPPATPPPPPPAVDIDRLDDAGKEAVLLVQTMIAAAHADGQVDADEQQRIVARAESSGLDAATCHFLKAALHQPVSIDALAARTRPDQVDEVYAAALLCMRADTEAERSFLTALAGRLGMTDARRQAIHEALQPV